MAIITFMARKYSSYNIHYHHNQLYIHHVLEMLPGCRAGCDDVRVCVICILQNAQYNSAMENPNYDLV